MAIHIPSFRNPLNHVHQSLHLFLPLAYFWHKIDVETGALWHNGVLGCDKCIQRVYCAGTVFAGSETLGSADTRYLLGS